MINEGSQSTKKLAIKLPQNLKYYENSDYIIQLKARFIYYLIFSALFLLIILILSSSYTQINNPDIGKIYLPVLIPELIVFSIILLSLFILIRGNYGFAAHLFMVSALLCVWAVIYFYKADIVARLDSIVLIVALMSLVPIFITKYKSTIFYYLIGNLIVLIALVYFLKDDLGFTHAEAIEFIMDNAIAIIFTGIVGYSIFNIHKQTLQRLDLDYKERIRVENELVKKSDEFERFFSTALDLFCIADTQGNFIRVNIEWEKILGYSTQELENKKFLEFVHPDDVEETLAALQRLDKQEEILNFTNRYRCKDGTYKYIEWRSTPYGQLVYAAARDITERKKTEKELKESELKYRTLFNNAQIGIYQTTPNGEILNANPAILVMLGFESFEELKRINLEVEQHYDNYGRTKFKELIEKNGSVQNLESKWIKKNGEIITVIENAKAVKDDEGKIMYYDGFVENITEKKKAEMALIDSEEKYRTLMESLNEVIIVADNNHVVQFVNKKFTEVLGYAPEEIIGKVGYKILHDPDDFNKIEEANNLRKNKNTSHYEMPFLTKDGRRIDMLVSGSPVIDADGKTIASIGAMIDITERKKAEKALIESQQQFETLAKMSPVGIFRTKPDGYTYYVNPKWCELSGLSFNDAQGDGWLKAVHPEDRGFLSKNWNSASADGEKSFAEYRFLKPDGSITWVLGNAIPEIIDGKLKGYIGTITNISEIKTAQEKIKESEKKFRDMADLLPIAVWETDLNGVCTYTNKVGFDIHTYTHEDFLAKINILTLLIPEDRERASENLKKRILGAPIIGEEYTGLKKDGHTFPVRVYTSAIFENDKPIGFRGVTVDLTLAKEAERELKESEEQLKMALLGANLGMWDWDMENNVIKINALFAEMLGYTFADFGGSLLQFDEWKKMVHPDDFYLVLRRFNEHIEQKSGLYEAEFRMKHKNGYWIWVLARGKVLEWNNDKPKRALGTHLEITKNKNSEKELKESEEKYRTLMENLNDVIMMVDNDDRVLYVNKKFTEKLGYTPDEIIGNIGYQVLVDQEYHDSIKKANQERLKKETSHYEMQFIAKNGTRIDFLISGAPVVNAEGKTIGSIGAMVDITDRKETEKALKESEERYRTIIEAFPDIIMISDLNSNIVFANSVLEKITGITPADYSNPKRLAHIYPEDVPIIKNAIKELLSGQKTHTGIIENRFVDSWGNLHWFSGIMSKLTINNQTYLQTISRDITEKKSVEKELDNYRQHLEFLVQERTDELATTNEELVSTNEELLNQREELEAVLLNLQNTQQQLIHAEKMASLGVLAAGVAHEINNPLNFIKGGVVGLESYLSENLKSHLDELAPLIDGMNTGIDRAAAIVTSLNHYSRKDDKPAIECNVHSIIDNCLVMLQNQFKHKIEITKKYTTKPHVLICNEGKIHQAILNVLSNAVQSIEGNGKITIKTDVKNDNIKLVFSDTGCGISEENLPKILDPFFTTKDPGKGTGLGLSITYNILQEHYGSIEFSSKLNKGTTVTIKLPLKQNE